MTEKYFATLMKKTPIGGNDYVYTVESLIAGDIDEETGLFTTSTGKQYKRVRDYSDYENTSEYYSNVVEISEIEKLFYGVDSLKEALSNYEERCKQVIYFVSKDESGVYSLMYLDKYTMTNLANKINNNPKYYDGEDSNTITPEEQQKIQMTEIDDEKIIQILQYLATDINEGRYTPDELIDIKLKLIEVIEEMEAAIDDINIQLEVTEEYEDSQSPIQQQAGYIDIKDIFSKVTKTLIAQDQAAERAIVELSRLDDMRKKDYGILLTGESGVGKTLLMSLLARYINRPFLAVDSTQLTTPGYAGKHIEEYLWELYESCGKDIEQAERAIIYFDEIDKKGSESKSDVSGQAVLNVLLKFLDGVSYVACKNPQMKTPDTTIKINTKNMLVVAGGAFLDVYKKQKPSVGFSPEEQKIKQESTEPQISDFIEKAMMTKEFMGRVPVIIHLKDLDIESIRRILLDSDDSSLKLQEEIFDKRGVKLTTKDGYILSVSQQALDRKIGARGLNKIIADTTWRAYADVCENPGVYEEIILTEETVEDPKKYQYVKRKDPENKNISK